MGWEVEIRMDGESILTIGDQMLSGVSDIERHADLVRNCAEHLLAFIGPAEPAPCFLCGGQDAECCCRALNQGADNAE